MNADTGRPEATAPTAGTLTAFPDSSPASIRHKNIANAALGLSIGGLLGTMLGIMVLPGLGITLFPTLGALIGWFLGSNATRLAERYNAGRATGP